MRCLLLLLLSCSAVYAQQNAMLLPWTPQQFTDTSGRLLTSGKVCTYLAGTSTGAATFTDATAAVSNNIPPNAILLDSTARPTSGGIWLTPNKGYKIVTMTAGTDNTCSTGVIIKTQDNVIANNAFGTNIRIVDGIRFAQSAAGINAADADLGANLGEVWIPSGGVTATDAQISIRTNHTLRIFGQLTINAASQGPILLAAGSRLSCQTPFNSASLVNVGVGITSMVRATVQDGSQLSGLYVDGCTINAGATTVTNGVIDASGSRNISYIRDNFIMGFTSGWGIFIQDVQSGALGGTSNVQIMNNQIAGTGTGGCIEILHSATNAVTLNSFDILDTLCSQGTTSTTGVVLQNTSVGTLLLRQINVQNLYIVGTPATQSGLAINGAQQTSVRNVTCAGGSSQNCVNIPSNANNALLAVDNVIQYSGNNVLNDVANSIVLLSAVQHYEFPANLTTYSYLPAVSYLKVNGLAPASATGTGFGTGPTFTFNAGSTNNAGVILVTAGTTPGASGTLTLNFNTTQTNFGVNSPACAVTLGNNTGTWNARATAILGTDNNTSVVVNWDNNAVNLTAGQIYDFLYWCAAK